MNTPINTSAKYFLYDYWIALESFKIKGCIGTKRPMPCLHIHTFILFSFLCFIFQSQRQIFLFFFFFFFFIIFYYSFYRYCIVKNNCCVFLASTLNSFCFVVNAFSVSSNVQASVSVFLSISILKLSHYLVYLWSLCKYFLYQEFSSKNLFLENHNKK